MIIGGVYRLQRKTHHGFSDFQSGGSLSDIEMKIKNQFRVLKENLVEKRTKRFFRLADIFWEKQC